MDFSYHKRLNFEDLKDQNNSINKEITAIVPYDKPCLDIVPVISDSKKIAMFRESLEKLNAFIPERIEIAWFGVHLHQKYPNGFPESKFSQSDDRYEPPFEFLF